jgi:thiaminase/transcriptional activator TenA
MHTKSASPFSCEAWERNARAYDVIRMMPFNTELAAGVLSPARFKHYITRIVQFAKAAEVAIVVERALHGSFFTQFGITPQIFAETPLSPTCHHYVSYLIATAYAEPYEVVLGALLPCFWIYAEVGRDIHARAAPSNPYQAWIDTYAGEEFHIAVRAIIETTDEAANTASPNMRDRMHAAYTRASQLEWAFWDSAYRLETWLT